MIRFNRLVCTRGAELQSKRLYHLIVSSISVRRPCKGSHLLFACPDVVHKNDYFPLFFSCIG